MSIHGEKRRKGGGGGCRYIYSRPVDSRKHIRINWQTQEAYINESAEHGPRSRFFLGESSVDACGYSRQTGKGAKQRLISSVEKAVIKQY